VYVIVDIETTGGNKNTGRITEIAAIKHDGEKIVDTFETLVNPLRPIPEFIRNLTGITDEMVNSAPTFQEIAAEFDRFTANTIFIAHNVNFDYRFIREEFRKLGKDFSRRKMCTVQLSRKAFPGLPSYSLNKITAELSISLEGHHRAGVDARATAKLFQKIIEKEQTTDLFDLHFGKPDFDFIGSPLIDEALIDSIPDESGVFRFFSLNDELLYVKRSQHMLTDICKKLTDKDTKSGLGLLGDLHRIDWTVLGSDLISQLDEAHEVLTKKPKYNGGRFSLRPRFAAYLKSDIDSAILYLDKWRKEERAELCFTNYHEGFHYLKEIAGTGNLELNFMKNGKYQTPMIDLSYYVEENRGGLFPEEEYAIIDEGRRAGEKSAVLVQGTQVVGYGFFEEELSKSLLSADDLDKCFDPIPELELVIRKYTEKGRYQKILPLD
jgi:DNA polymerase-3 subunit epsilon